MTKPILLDTGVIVALLDRSERRHKECAKIVTKLKNPLITCEPVITEACYILRKLHGAPESILANVENHIFQIPWTLSGNEKQVSELLKKYSKVPMDFTDACLVSMAEHFDTGEILSLDSDFKVYKWKRKKEFKILIPPPK